MLTIKNISEQFGLPEKFLRRCIKALEEELQPFMKRGGYNAIQFTTASTGIFEQIKIHKGNNLSIPEIVKEIQKNLPSSSSKKLGKRDEQTIENDTQNIGKQGGQTIENYSQQDLINRLLEAEKEKYNAKLEVSQMEKTELENRLTRYENDIKLLTDGSTTDMKEFLKNRAEIEVERKNIVDELEKSSFWEFRKKKKLLSKLKNILK